MFHLVSFAGLHDLFPRFDSSCGGRYAHPLIVP